MLRIADGRATRGRNAEVGRRSAFIARIIPRAIGIALVVYLAPLILAVLVIGGTTIVAGKLARAVLRVIDRPAFHPGDSRLVALPARWDEGQARSAYGRRRIRAGR